jgi:hypothetical protein
VPLLVGNISHRRGAVPWVDRHQGVPNRPPGGGFQKGTAGAGLPRAGQRRERRKLDGQGRRPRSAPLTGSCRFRPHRSRRSIVGDVAAGRVQQPTNSHQRATIASPPAVLRPPRALTWNTVRPLRGQRRLPPRQARNPGSLNESSFAPASHQRHAISQCKSSCQSPPHRAPTRPPTLEPAPSTTTNPHVTPPGTGAVTAPDS